MVEFAIVLPVLILIIMGILYFGRYFNYTNQMTQMAEQGARWAAVDVNPGGTSQTLQAYIFSQLPPELQNGDSDVTQAQVYIYYPATTGPPAYTSQVGLPVRVCVTTQLNYPFINVTGSVVAESATLRVEVADMPTGSPPTQAFKPDNTPPAASGCPLG